MLLNLLGATLLPVIVTVALFLIEKKLHFFNLSYKVKQIVIGLVFAAVAVFSSDYTEAAEGVVISVRDAAPLCAGLTFGSPAGIIAGCISGVVNLASVLWLGDSYTRIAGSIALVLTGILAGFYRSYLFDNKRPSFYYALSIGLVAEVIHMLLVFLTNIHDIHNAFSVVRVCAAPMILSCSLSISLALFVVALISREKLLPRKGIPRLSTKFQRWLLVNMVVALLATSIFTIVLQTGLSQNSAVELLQLNINDVRADISDASDANLLKLTHRVAEELDKTGDYSHENLLTVTDKVGVTEIDVIDKNGIIVSCTIDAFEGFDMSSGEQSREFLCLLDGTDEFVQSYQPISYDQTLSRKYAGVALETGGFVQVGYDASEFHKDIASQIVGVTRNRHVGENGCIIICDENWFVVSDRNNCEGENLSKTGIWIDRGTMPEGEHFISEVYGEKCLCMYEINEGYYIIAVLPESEATFTRDVAVYVYAFMEVLTFCVMFALIYLLVKKLVVVKIQEINDTLAAITDGNLDVSVNVRSTDEFNSLSDDINSTVETLKHYIDEAEARIDKELEFARSIQFSALPSVFPPYPNRTDFEIYADMFTAKEVGGDFYDFYLLDEEHLAILIADVSGKGIPAAMFMMTAKTMIKSMVESGLELAEAFETANNKLCENNEAGMFVTVWMGILNTKTRVLSFINAGHNPPLVKLGSGGFEYLKSKPDLIVACADGVRYHTQQIKLSAGDKLFLYTDGVTEATNSDNKLYGEKRLQNVLNVSAGSDVRSLCGLVKESVDRFVAEAPQFDDITMLAIEIKE